MPNPIINTNNPPAVPLKVGTQSAAAAVKPAWLNRVAAGPASVVSMHSPPAPDPGTYARASLARPPVTVVVPNPVKADVPPPAPEGPDGASFIAGEGPVVVDILHSDSGYENKIYWTSDNWKTRQLLGVDDQTGSHNLGTFAPGTRIQFGILNGESQFLKAGAASTNPDNLVHAKVDVSSSGMKIGFEDLYGGGDRDFNDAIVNVHSLSKVDTGPVGGASAAAARKPEPVRQPPPSTPAPPVQVVARPRVEVPAPPPAAKETRDNRSGLGDGTNPGRGAGSAQSPNQGTANPSKAPAVKAAPPPPAPKPAPAPVAPPAAHKEKTPSVH